MKALETDLAALQTEIIEKDTEMADLQTKLNKIQTAPNVAVGESLGRSYFYTKQKTPDEYLREIISHTTDFHRCK